MSLVREHLTELGITDEWIIELGEKIQEVQKKDPALSAGRAMDLASQEETAKSLKLFIEGWKGLMGSNIERFTPNQKETLSLVIKTIVQETNGKIGKLQQ